MIKQIRRESELWTEDYMSMMRVALTCNYKLYGKGIVDGAENTCEPAFMAGVRSALRNLVQKVKYDKAPEKDADILAIGYDDEKKEWFHAICHVDGNRRLQGGMSESEMKFWIDVDDIMEYILNGVSE